jgi:hypothetical protein
MPAPVRLRNWDWRESGPGDFADAELGGLAVIAVAMVVFLVIWPIVAIALELIILMVICLGGIAGRVLLRPPWTVIARSEATGAPRLHEWRVVGVSTTPEKISNPCGKTVAGPRQTVTGPPT